MSIEDQDRGSVFHERISVLRDHGYRGFSVSKIRKEWDGVQVTVQNDRGKTVTVSGDTNEEAYKKAIDQIDMILDDAL